MTDKLIIFDTTLRDGEQSPGASMTKEEKIRIAKHLERMKVDVIEAEARQALVHRLGHEIGDPPTVGCFQAELGAEIDVVALPTLEDAPQRLFRFTVAINRGGVDVVDAQFEGAGESSLLIGRRSLCHEATNGAGTEAQHANLQSGSSQSASFHCFLPCDGNVPRVC